jgi:hypothetical protein
MAIFKKSSRKHASYESSGVKKFFIGLLIVLLAAAILGGFWFLSQLGPRDVDYREIDYNSDIPESVKHCSSGVSSWKPSLKRCLRSVRHGQKTSFY